MNATTPLKRRPLTAGEWTWLVLLALATAGGVVGLVPQLGAITVHLTHGFEQPILVSVDGAEPITVQPNAVAQVRVGVGSHTFSARSRGGLELETVTLPIPAGYDVAAYNVAGSAPLLDGETIYGDGAGRQPEPPTSYSGNHLALARDVNFKFQEPPKSISVDSKSGSYHLRRFFLALPGGWERAWPMAMEGAGPLPALHICRMAVLLGEKASAYDCLRTTAEALGKAGAVRMLEQLAEQRPDEADLQLALVATRMDVDPLEEVQREQRRTQQARPQDGVAAAMLARVLPLSEADALLDRVLKEDAHAVEALRLMSLARAAQGKHREAADLLGSMADRPEYKRHTDDHVAALLMSGNAVAAVELATSLHTKAGATSWQDVLLHAQVLRVTRGTNPSAEQVLAARHAKQQVDSEDVYLRASAGLPPQTVTGTSRLDRLAALMWMTGASPEQAVNAMDGWEGGGIPRELAVLLFLEAQRTGHLRAAESAAAAGHLTALEQDELTATVLHGAPSTLLWRLGDDDRAAMELVALRHRQSRGDNVTAAVEVLRRRPILSGPVAQAVAGWPPAPPAWVAVER